MGLTLPSQRKPKMLRNQPKSGLWYSPVVTSTPEPVGAPPDGTTRPDGSNPAPPDAVPPFESLGRFAQRLIACIEIVVCSATQFVLALVLLVAGVQAFDVDGQLSFAYVVTLSLMDAAVLIALILFFLRVHHERPRDLFLGDRPIRHESLVGILFIPAVVLSVLAAFVFIQRFVPWLHNVPENPLEALIQSPGDAWMFGVVTVVAGGVREEMQRAFILRRFEQHLGGGLVGLLVFSAVFGWAHKIQGWDAAIITSLLGVFWGATYLVRRSIIAPVVSHSGFNVAEIIRYLAYL